MLESDFEIHLDYTKSEFIEYDALARRRQQATVKRSFWNSGGALVGLCATVSGLVSLLAVTSGASSSQSGDIIAVLAFAAFYAGFWTPSMIARLSAASWHASYKSDFPNLRLLVTDAGIWLSSDTGWRSFLPYSYFRSATVQNGLLALWAKAGRPLIMPVRLLTPEQQARLIEPIGTRAPEVS